MKTFQAYVWAGSYAVKTLVLADSLQSAYFLLQGQYGADNIVHLPTEVI